MKIIIALLSMSLAASAATTDPAWTLTMRQLAVAYSDIFPFLANDPPLPVDNLAAKVDRIAQLSATVDEHLADQGNLQVAIDPSLKFVSRIFRQNTAMAALYVNSGYPEDGGRLLRQSFSYCIACHTSDRLTTKFPVFSNWQEQLGPAPWIRKIEMGAALGQFSTVYEWVKSAIVQRPEGVSALDLERGVRVALAASIRSKQNLDEASELVRLVQTSPNVEPFLRSSALIWTQDLQKLKALNFPGSENELLQDATELIGAKPINDEAPLPRRHEILYLATSQLMHELVRRYPESPNLARAFLLLGISYDGLRDIGLWSLHELYYEACVRQAPHTGLARNCFKRYEQSVLEGQGRPHTRPPFLESHLEELRVLAADTP